MGVCTGRKKNVKIEYRSVIWLFHFPYIPSVKNTFKKDKIRMIKNHLQLPFLPSHLHHSLRKK